MVNAAPPEEITTREVMELLGVTQNSTVVRYVHDRTLTPTRKLPGKNGTYLFRRADVLAFAERRRQELLNQAAAIAERTEAVGGAS